MLSSCACMACIYIFNFQWKLTDVSLTCKTWEPLTGRKHQFMFIAIFSNHCVTFLFLNSSFLFLLSPPSSPYSELGCFHLHLVKGWKKSRLSLVLGTVSVGSWFWIFFHWVGMALTVPGIPQARDIMQMNVMKRFHNFSSNLLYL